MKILHNYTGSSFTQLLKNDYPELLPTFPKIVIDSKTIGLIPEGTTIAALKFADGVIIGADRRATAGGHLVVNESVVKVFKTDDYSAIAIAGTFGPSVKMAKLLQTELEHYEKIEGIPLTIEGKANKLSYMVELNLPAAMQGLPVMPLFVGYDTHEKTGKIFEYDITGGTFTKPKQEPFSTSGSGGERAYTTFEHFYKEG
ncbi:proteasome subunit beta, partial [bacterium]|nr:proteasome subunit beta [bacterium]